MNRLRNYVLVAGALVVCSALAALPSQSSADTVLAQTADPPAAPAGLAIAAGDQSVTLTWDDPSDSTITGYEYRARANLPDFSWIDWTAVSGSDASTTSMTLSGLANGIEYRFMVRAVNANGAGDSAPDGDPGYIAATPRAPPGPVASVTVTRGDGSLDASWDAVDGATSYHITYSSDGKQSWSLAALNHPDASITVSGVDNASTYIIGVRARNASGSSGMDELRPRRSLRPNPAASRARRALRPDRDGGRRVHHLRLERPLGLFHYRLRIPDPRRASRRRLGGLDPHTRERRRNHFPLNQRADQRHGIPVQAPRDEQRRGRRARARRRPLVRLRRSRSPRPNASGNPARARRRPRRSHRIDGDGGG